MIKLYNYFRSSTSFRVRIALHLKNIKFEYLPVHLLNEGGEQNKKFYRELNPMGEVPTLVDGDIRIGQSFAILEYLEDQYPETKLFPDNFVAKAMVRQFCENINCGIHPLHNLKVLQYLEGNLAVGQSERKQWISYWITKGLTAAEETVSRTAGKFCFGNQVTMADLFLVPQLFSSERFEVDLTPFAKLNEIKSNCMALDPFKLAHPGCQPDTPEELKIKL